MSIAKLNNNEIYLVAGGNDVTYSNIVGNLVGIYGGCTMFLAVLHSLAAKGSIGGNLAFGLKFSILLTAAVVIGSGVGSYIEDIMLPNLTSSVEGYLRKSCNTLGISCFPYRE
jgi:hypothetical protein